VPLSRNDQMKQLQVRSHQIKLGTQTAAKSFIEKSPYSIVQPKAARKNQPTHKAFNESSFDRSIDEKRPGDYYSSVEALPIN